MALKRTAHRNKKVSGGFSRKNRRTLKNHRKPVTVGLIHASWCGHCRALLPEWKKMKASMRGANYNYLEIEDSDPHKDRKIALVNSRLKGEKLTVNGYPTIYKVHNGKLEYYQGERTAQAMQKWFGGNASAPEPAQEPIKPLMQRFFGGKKQKGGDCGCGKSIFTTNH
jgi:thiol-disulfide isomerase/thioredoxin